MADGITSTVDKLRGSVKISAKPERIVSFNYSKDEELRTAVQEGKRLQVPVAHTSEFPFIGMKIVGREDAPSLETVKNGRIMRIRSDSFFQS